MSFRQRLFAVIPVALFLLSATPGWADVLNAGFLWDSFELTLSPGHRLEVLGPLFYEEQKESQHTWAFPPLLSYTKDPEVELKEFDFLYPILTYDQYGKQYRWQLLQLLSFSGGPMPDDNRDRFTLFPFYFHQRSSDPTQNYTAVAPFYGHLRHHFFRDEIYFVMFPLYSETRKKDVITDNYVYPFFHLRHGPGMQGWQFWPLLGHEHKEVTTRTNGFNEVETIAGHDKRFVLWPIYFNDHTAIGTPNLYWQQAILPLYSFERSAQRDSTTVLWPFFSKIDDRTKKYKEWDAPWPLIEFARGEGKTTSRVWPFFSQSHSPTLQHDFYAWPIYKYERARLNPLDHQRTRILFYLYSDTIDTNTDTGKAARWSYLWPIYIRHKERNGNMRLQVLAPLEPLVPGSHKVPRDYSPLWSLWRSEDNPTSGAASQSLLWNLYRRDVKPDQKKVSLLFGLFQYQSGPEFKRWRLFYIPFGGRAPAKAEFSDLVKP